jgi:RimJ/RimL family protein N-acetyltransferase
VTKPETAGIRFRRATGIDVDFMLAVFTHDDVRPYLAAGGAFDRDALVAELAQQEGDPGAFGRFVIEVDDGGKWRSAGTMGFKRVNERSRIAHLERLAVHPDFRGRHLADTAARLFQRHLIFDLGFHRLQMEVYAYNERARRHAERVGWIEEGVKRKAYRSGDGWVDGVMYSILREDLEGRDVLQEHVQRFNAGVRSGDFMPMLEQFADDAEMSFEGVSVGPFVGVGAIAQAYREQPPDDELDVLDVRQGGDTLVAGYAWRREPDRRAGELRLSVESARITRLVVTFD